MTGGVGAAGYFKTKGDSVKMQKCKVLRAFMFDRKPTKVGEELSLPLPFATELRAANKVEFIPDAPVPVQPPQAPAAGANKGGGK